MVGLEDFGSTAIPGLAAKPIIDIQIEHLGREHDVAVLAALCVQEPYVALIAKQRANKAYRRD
jgi:GrpB-like predicted nucleotidyltransferase (UPF0157 family)